MKDIFCLTILVDYLPDVLLAVLERLQCMSWRSLLRMVLYRSQFQVKIMFGVAHAHHFFAPTVYICSGGEDNYIAT